MLSLKKLRFCNIGRFVEEQEIDFTNLDKLVQVNGFNKNTGGSSGAAKSTVFHAHDYLLGINDIPATGLQSRLTKNAIYAEGEYDVDGVTLIVRRSKKDGLTIKFGDEEVSGNVKLAEERLDEIIGIPKKLFKKMVHKKQKEGGFFLNLTAKESYDFLMNALGLEQLKLKTAKIDEDIKEITSRITQLGHAITALTDSIEEIDELKEFEKPPRCDVNVEDLDKLESELAHLHVEIDSVEKSRDENINKLTALRPVKHVLAESSEDTEMQVLEYDLAALKTQKQTILMEHLNKKGKISNAADEIKKKLSNMIYVKATIERKAGEMKELLAQKAHIESSKCPTCMQQWAGDTAASKITTINTKLAELKTDILKDKVQVDEEPELKVQLERLTAILSKLDVESGTEDIDSKINEISSKMISIKSTRNAAIQKLENEYLVKLNDYNEKIRATKESYELTLSPKRNYIESLRRDVSSKKDALKFHAGAMDNYKAKMEKYESTLAEKRANLKDALQQREDRAKELSVAEEAKRLIKTYTLQIFQETLDYIGNYATEILSDIPNMSNATIYFEGCKENKSGTIKDEVNAIINMDGYNDINIKTLSGGERTAIDLAVDLSVIDMIESKAGKGADYFILDEPFDGLEDINISQCLEVLKQTDTNKKIIIVDHNPIAKEMITDSIMVERDGEESVVL